MHISESSSDQWRRERRAAQEAERDRICAANRARFRAQQTATQGELWAQAEARHLRAERARETQRTGRRARRPKRLSAPPVEMTRQYHQAGSTSYIRDVGLCDGARRLAALLLALSGTGSVIDRIPRGGLLTKGKLAARLSRSRRTIQRYLRELEERGYIDRVETTYCPRTGMLSGLKIRLLPKLLPWWRTKKPEKVAENVGETKTSSLKDTAIKIKKPRLSEADSWLPPASRTRSERPPTPT